MRYVTVQSSDGGTMTDVRPYLEWLDEHADELPPGARAFALDPEHYDFSHQWSPRGAGLHRSSSCGTAVYRTSSPTATMAAARVRGYLSTSCYPTLTA